MIIMTRRMCREREQVLFGLFYRPSSSDAEYFSSIEDSIFLAIDTGIKDVIITGDFNCNMFNPRTGWRPVVAAYQWWPFAFCTRNYAFVATQIWPVCKRKQKKHLQRKIDQIFCLRGKRQVILPTYSHSSTIAVPGGLQSFKHK